MTDSTPETKKNNTIINIKNKLARPSSNALLFVQMFARAYCAPTLTVA